MEEHEAQPLRTCNSPDLKAVLPGGTLTSTPRWRAVALDASIHQFDHPVAAGGQAWVVGDDQE